MKNSKCVVRCGGLVWRGLMAASIVAGIVCLGAGNVGAAEPEQVFASGYGPWSVRNPNDMGVSVTAWGDGSGMRDVGGISMSIGQTISLSGSAREFHSATFYFSVQSFDPEVGPGSVVDPRTYLRFYEPIFVPLDDPRSQWIVYGEDEDTYYNYGQLQARLGSGEDPWLRDAEWNYVRWSRLVELAGSGRNTIVERGAWLHEQYDAHFTEWVDTDGAYYSWQGTWVDDQPVASVRMGTLIALTIMASEAFMLPDNVFVELEIGGCCGEILYPVSHVAEAASGMYIGSYFHDENPMGQFQLPMDIRAIPEPATVTLLSAGAALLLRRRRPSLSKA